MLTVPRHHLDHGMPCQTKDISVIKALILAAMIGEHWVCATPVDSKINLADIFLFDFEVEEKIVQKSGTGGATLRQTFTWSRHRSRGGGRGRGIRSASRCRTAYRDSKSRRLATLQRVLFLQGRR